MINYKENQYGFEYGAATITRLHSIEETGQVYIALNTPKEDIQIYVTKTGKVRVFSPDGKEWKRQ